MTIYLTNMTATVGLHFYFIDDKSLDAKRIDGLFKILYSHIV